VDFETPSRCRQRRYPHFPSKPTSVGLNTPATAESQAPSTRAPHRASGQRKSLRQQPMPILGRVDENEAMSPATNSALSGFDATKDLPMGRCDHTRMIMTSVALIKAAAVWPGLSRISRAEVAVMIDVICCSPIEIFTSAISPLMRTLSIRPTS
jgi:hypothetical protein